MDSDAWRPFDPVDVKRRVGPGAGGNNRQVFVEPSSDEDDDDGDALPAISNPAAIHLAGCERGDFHHAQN